MCDTYSPITPSTISWIPPTIPTRIMIEVQPGTTKTPANLEMTAESPKRIDAIETTNPRFRPRRSGRFEKPMTASVARRSIRTPLYLLRPAGRGGEAYGTPDWREPTPLDTPAREPVASRLP